MRRKCFGCRDAECPCRCEGNPDLCICDIPLHVVFQDPESGIPADLFAQEEYPPSEEFEAATEEDIITDEVCPNCESTIIYVTGDNLTCGDCHKEFFPRRRNPVCGECGSKTNNHAEWCAFFDERGGVTCGECGLPWSSGHVCNFGNLRNNPYHDRCWKCGKSNCGCGCNGNPYACICDVTRRNPLRRNPVCEKCGVEDCKCQTLGYCVCDKRRNPDPDGNPWGPSLYNPLEDDHHQFKDDSIYRHIASRFRRNIGD